MTGRYGAGALTALFAALSPAMALAQPAQWADMPRMELEAQYAGPLRDTIGQRYRDPIDGTLCFIYLPITVQHTQPNANGLVTYGGNTIGSISCLIAPPAGQAEPQPEN